MSARERRYREEGRLWGRSCVDRVVLGFGEQMAAGAMSDAQETAIALAFRVEVEARCVGMLRDGALKKLVVGFGQGAIVGFHDRCKELAAMALTANDNPA